MGCEGRDAASRLLMMRLNTLNKLRVALFAGMAGLLLAVAVAATPATHAETAADEEIQIALNLAKLLQIGRTVISANQDLINDASVGDKGLTGDKVLADTVERYRQATGVDLNAIDPETREGRMLLAEMQAIREVVDDNQKLINEQGIGFKGFIPAVFGRLVTERFQEKMGTEAEMKVTAPPALVRNRKARPDEWERRIIEEKFMSPDWERGEIFAEAEPSKGREAFRVMVPEYYAASCLTCHGENKGDIDITGYPKEGASEGDLGGVISISLFLTRE